MSHDARGNMTSDGVATFGYNLKNQLVAKNGTTQLYYDPKGRLSEQWNGGGTLDWAGDELIQDGNRRYVHGPGTDEPLVWYEGISGRYFLHADERGSIVAVSNDAGNAYAINRYDEYGVPQAGNFGRFQYTGQLWLPEIGRYYYKARTYNPTLGRFDQTDPVGYEDQINLYAYVGNDPINSVDPSGMIQEDEYRFSLGALTLSASNKGVSLSASISGGNALISANTTGFFASASAKEGSVKFSATHSGAEASASVGKTNVKAAVTSSGVSASASNVTKAGQNLAAQIGTNRISVMTPSGRMSIDLAGKSHFDKIPSQEIPTPHVKFQQLNTAPNERTNLSPGTTRPATMRDIRIAREITKRRDN